MNDWYRISADEVLQRLKTSADGLDGGEVQRRRSEYGANRLIDRRGRGAGRILAEQFYGPIIWLLIVAVGVSLFVQEYLDAAVIAAIVVLNGLLGFVQEYRAEKAMAALRQLSTPEVNVRRGGREQAIGVEELVPGDVVMLQAGNRVPADARVLEAHQLHVQEAALTGESEAVTKQSAALAMADLSIGDLRNMVFMGTDISSGTGVAVVTETGMKSQLGQIADMLQTARDPRTPLQRRLASMGVWLAIATIAIIAVVFVLGLLRGQDPTLMLMTSLSLAVAAVPEGLPAVATISLALGARRMLRRKALIRQLPAVETLGSVTVICSDKTGTLTENRMRVYVLRHAGGELPIEQHLQPPGPAAAHAAAASQVKDAFHAGTLQLLQQEPVLGMMLLTGALCNDARLADEHEGRGECGGDPADSELVTEGDPTEGALLVAAARICLPKGKLLDALPRVAEVPFDTDRKRMTTVHELSGANNDRADAVGLVIQFAETLGQGTHLGLLKGAADEVLDVCSSVWVNGGLQPLGECERLELLGANDELAARGQRVLGLAARWFQNKPCEESAAAIEQEFVFLGLAGLMDPPRHEARQAVERCRAAGIRPVMITGDHPLTALHIAERVGISHGGRSLTGRDLEQQTDAELENLVGEVSVYARASPHHKLRIVRAMQKRGEIVAMTGDGVNDAPALKTADIGVAMGITGTDVSKEASDVVLLDDNFATIVNAVEEGRTIYDNIRKFLKYVMTCNTGEIWVMVAAPFLGMPLPLLPLQILWINLVTDGLPGLAMSLEPAEPDTMRRPPRDPREPILTRTMVIDILVIGLLMAVFALGTGYYYWLGAPTATYDPAWGTKVFMVLTLSQMGNALANRSSRESLLQIGLLSNRALLAAVALTFLLQLVVVYVPSMQRMFRTTPLSLSELLTCLLMSTLVFWCIEAQKWWRRRSGEPGLLTGN